MNTNKLKEIRLKMGYSVRGFANLLGRADSTYQHCENGSRTAQYDQILAEAKEAYKRDRRFFTVDMPKRIDAVPVFLGEACE